MGLKSTVLRSAARAIRLSGLPAVVRRANRDRPTIVFYHDPKPACFEAHLRYLSARFDFVSFDAIVDALRSGDWSEIPKCALAFTFDDGHRGNYELLPLFRRYEVRPLIYLCSAIVGTDNGFWFNEPVEIQTLKRVRNRERLESLARETGFTPEAARPGPRQALSRAEILEMAPWVDFGSHTRTHPMVTQCDPEEAIEEIEGSKRDLEQLLERPCRHFCSPNGDWGEREVELIRNAGYDSARTTDVGWIGRDADLYRLKIAAISDDASIDKLAAQLAGMPRYAKNLARGHFGGEWPQQPIARV